MKVVQEQRELLASPIILVGTAPIEGFLEQQLLDVARQTSPIALHGFAEHRRQLISVDLHALQTQRFGACSGQDR